MPHAYVISVTYTDDQLTFRVNVEDFKDTAGSVEISGQAVQAGGAFVNIYAIAPVPTTPGDNDESYVDVPVAVPPNEFKKDQDITIFMRVSKVWVTVLREHNSSLGAIPPGQPAGTGTTWDKLMAVAQLNGDSPPW